MTVVPFQPIHLEILSAQGVQPAQISHVPASCAKFSRPLGPCVTAFDGEQVILCGGIVSTPGLWMGIAWAVLSKDAGKHMVWIHRAVKRFIEMQDLRRIEATVEESFSEGCRWARILGFEYEGSMRCFGENGETHLRFAWVK